MTSTILLCYYSILRPSHLYDFGANVGLTILPGTIFLIGNVGLSILPVTFATEIREPVRLAVPSAPVRLARNLR